MVKGKNTRKEGETVKKIPLILVLIIFLVFAVPTYVAIGRSDLSTPPAEWVSACQWVSENTPEDAIIVAWWDYGYWIRYISGREVYVTPGQHPDTVKLLAQNFLTYNDTVQWPAGNIYLMIDEISVYDFQRSMATWAGLDHLTVAYKKTLINRLYSGGVPGYQLVYDGKIKVLKVER